MNFFHEGYSVTALSIKLHTIGVAAQYQAAFTLQGHAGDISPSHPAGHLVFDSHAKALRSARKTAKQFIALIDPKKGTSI